jgi:formate dehydrogenase major subunit
MPAPPAPTPGLGGRATFSPPAPDEFERTSSGVAASTVAIASPAAPWPVREMTRGCTDVRPAGNRAPVPDRRLGDHVPPLLRQLKDPLGLGRAAQSRRSATLTPRTKTADKMVRSICPYCAVGCGQRVYAKDGKVTQIEGDPDSPISRGRLCPKGAASEQYVNSALRETRVKYRRPGATSWEHLDLDTAMDMIADRVIATRRETWEEATAEGQPLNRTRGFGLLGGATLDSEENYLIKKFFTAMGAIQIENQARI